MKFSVALSIITTVTTSLFHSVVVDAAESKLHRGARGASIRQEERRLMMDGKGDATPAPKSMPKVMTRGEALNDFFFDSPPCPECKQELPGYSFFGDLYFQDNFFALPYRDAVLAVRAGQAVTPLGPAGGFLVDSCIEDPNPLCLGGLGPTPTLPPVACNTATLGGLPLAFAAGEAKYEFCQIAAGITEIIYSVDFTRCLLLSIQKTAREILCYIADSRFSEVLNPDLATGQRKLFSQRLERVEALRKLNEEKTLENTLLPMDGILMTMEILGVTTLPQLLGMFNVTNTVENVLYPVPSSTRRLSPEPIRSDEGSEFVADINDFLNDFLNANTEQVLESNLFMLKCTEIFELSFPLCITLFSLFKTTDAAICYYQDELGCTIDESCTKDLSFTTEYNKRRAALYLPGILSIGGDPEDALEDPSNFILGEILAPCSTCASAKNQCAPYCNYVDGFETCDVVKRAYLIAFT